MKLLVIVDVVVGWTVVVSTKVLEVMEPLLKMVSVTDRRTVSSLTCQSLKMDLS